MKSDLCASEKWKTLFSRVLTSFLSVLQCIVIKFGFFNICLKTYCVNVRKKSVNDISKCDSNVDKILTFGYIIFFCQKKSVKL